MVNRKKLPLFLVYLLLVLCGGSWSQQLLAEPYLAVREGVTCSACHTNPTGGGKRNAFGRIYGQSVLPAGNAKTITDHRLHDFFDVGGNFRFQLQGFEEPDAETTLAFETERANLYLETTLIKQQLSLYLDQQFSPASDNREAWVMYRPQGGKFYVKAGKLFLPFGLRLQDDSAFVRARSGINFLAPDNGIEVGIDSKQWSAQFSLSNGSAGGSENNREKQFNASAVYVHPGWRIGTSAGFNNGINNQDRQMLGVFSGARVIGSEILAEIDWIEDTNVGLAAEDIQQLVAFLEINHEVRKGSNLKLSFDYLDPDVDVSEDHQSRVSLVWELTAMPFLQVRLGTRRAEGIPQNPAQNRDAYFVQLHTWY